VICGAMVAKISESRSVKVGGLFWSWTSQLIKYNYASVHLELELPRSNSIDHLLLIDDWFESVDINMDISPNDVVVFVCGAGTWPFGIEQKCKVNRIY
jgi:hypothetical protein